MKQMQKIQELDKHAEPLNTTSAVKPFKKIACKFCGGKHTYGKNLCPAFGKRCFNCNKPNHFSSVCTQPHKNIKCVEEEEEEARKDNSAEDFLYYIRPVETVSGQGKQWFVNVKLSVNNQRHSDVRCQLDCGLTCNTIGYVQFRKLARSSSPKLYPSDVKLRVYNGSIIELVEKAQIKCAYNGKSYDLTIQVLNNNITPLLSAEICTRLGLLSVQTNLVNSPKVNDISYTVDDDLITEYEDTFTGLGCLPGKYHIEVDENVTSIF